MRHCCRPVRYDRTDILSRGAAAAAPAPPTSKSNGLRASTLRAGNRMDRALPAIVHFPGALVQDQDLFLLACSVRHGANAYQPSTTETP